ncbi:MAG: GNAT family N-acetyltransferase [Alphaproteobacteria bacterium]|nr:GNAT family N-acetyltransferase [Alphaproteobacteria bacterium]
MIIEKTDFSECLNGEQISLFKGRETENFAQCLFAEIEASRDYMLPWLEWVKEIKTIKDASVHISARNEDWKKSNKPAYAIFNKVNHFVGYIWVHRIDEKHRFAELGYWISLNFSRNGYAKEAIGLIEQELFYKNFERVIIRTDTKNIASTSLAKSLGYFLEGVERHDRFSNFWQNFRSHNVFTKLSEEFKNQSKNHS